MRFLVVLPLGTMALIGSLGSLALNGSVAPSAKVLALILLARLLLGNRVVGSAHSLLGLLSHPLGLHELGHYLEFIIPLLQSPKSKFDVSILVRVARQHVPNGGYCRLMVEYTNLAKLAEICANFIPHLPQFQELAGFTLGFLGILEG